MCSTSHSRDPIGVRVEVESAVADKPQKRDAGIVRKLDRGEPQPETVASASAASGQAPESSEEIHY